MQIMKLVDIEIYRNGDILDSYWSITWMKVVGKTIRRFNLRLACSEAASVSSEAASAKSEA